MASIIEMSCFINNFCQMFATCLATSFQQDNAPAHTARKTMQLLTCETPDFIVPALWPASSPDLNPVDYQTWGSIAAGFMTLTSRSHD